MSLFEMLKQTGTSSKTSKPTVMSIPFLRLAFRPFFLFASVSSIISLTVWLLVLQSKLSWQGILPATIWHAHEMVFAFAATVVIGFLLTAAQTWTGVQSIHGWKLAILALLWIVARIAFYAHTPTVFVVGIVAELLWWSIAIGYLAYMFVKSNNQKNMVFIPLLLILMLLDLSILIFASTENILLAKHLSISAVFMLTAVVTIIGGRVIPFFTSRALNLSPIVLVPKLEQFVATSMLITLIVFIGSYFVTVNLIGDHIEIMDHLIGILFLLTGGGQLCRTLTWQTSKTFRTPLLWSLHLSYINLGIGFCLIGVSYFTTTISFSSALHIVTVGTLGTMILAMMSRVTLGHTGRVMQIKPVVSVSFALLLCAAIFRSVLPIFGWHQSGYLLAGIAWLIGFSIYLVIYTPYLLKSRIDGRNG